MSYILVCTAHPVFHREKNSCMCNTHHTILTADNQGIEKKNKRPFVRGLVLEAWNTSKFEMTGISNKMDRVEDDMIYEDV